MKTIIRFCIAICCLSCITTNYSQAQNNKPDTTKVTADESFLVGTWVADTLNEVNNKTGKKKPDLDFIWSKFIFNAEGKGKILWNYRTDGGGKSYFTWEYSKSDSVLKIVSTEHNTGYWKFTHISDSCIDLIDFGKNHPDKNKPLPKTQEEKKYVRNEIAADDYSSNAYNMDAIPVYTTEKLQILTGNKYFTGDYHITVNLFELTGRQVKTLLNNKVVPSSTLVVQWLNFKDVPPGIYILSISDGNTIKESVKIERK